ncbi:phage tail protein [Pedobacter sp. WC2423]|uniref:phage tail protein n=1 Tax=Pedobacter sp. WC2423 TaxID=3234142 RepID=UPI003466FFC1
MSASQPYIGEITIFGGNFAPLGWAFCDGSLLAISENDTLFNLIGTTYGGDGQNTFAVPDLRGRVPIHMGTNPQSGTNYVVGQMAGVESVTLVPNQLPAHAHVVTGELNMKVRANDPDNQPSPVDNGIAIAPGKRYFSRTPTASGLMPLDTSIVLSGAGNSQAHDNMQPYMALNFIISLSGIYPTPD